MGTLLWGDDNVADYWCGGPAPRTSSKPEYTTTLASIERYIADERAGKRFVPPTPSATPLYEAGSLPPVVRWHPIARAFAAFVISGAVIYGAMYFLPVIAQWIKR